jgi:hypothetical protein
MDKFIDTILHALAREPLFYGLTFVDGLVLFAVGVIWSALLWLVVEGLKKRAPSIRGTRWTRWGPLAFSAAASIWAVPFAVGGVREAGMPELTPLSVAAFAGVGLAGGLGSKWAHDTSSAVVSAARDRVISMIRGT